MMMMTRRMMMYDDDAFAFQVVDDVTGNGIDELWSSYARFFLK
jgi:hypothetical protein